MRRTRVRHLIRPHQLDPGWVVARAYRFGRSTFWVENAGDARPGGRTLWGLPRWQYGRLVSSHLAIAAAGLSGDRRKRFKARWDASYWRGYLREAFGEGAALRRGR